MIRKYAVEIYTAAFCGLLLAALTLTGIALMHGLEAPTVALWMLAAAFVFGIMAMVASEVRAGVLEDQ